MTGEIETRLREDFGSDKVFEARIRNNIALAKAQQAGVDIFSFEKNSNGAADYRRMAEEFLRRVGKQ